MIAAQSLGISFNGFLRVAAVPALLSLPVVWGVIALLYRGRWRLAAVPGAPRGAAAPRVAVNRLRRAKAAAVTLGVVAAFVLTDWPRELIALAGASLMLVNRTIASSDMLRHVDGDLLLMLMGLFVVNAGARRHRPAADAARGPARVGRRPAGSALAARRRLGPQQRGRQQPGGDAAGAVSRTRRRTPTRWARRWRSAPASRRT